MAMSNAGAAVHEKAAGAMLSAIQYANQAGVHTFILNHDIKYRLGRGNEDDADD